MNHYYVPVIGLNSEKLNKMAAVMEQWSHAGTSFLSLFFMAMIIFRFYNIYFLHACFILYNLSIFVLHNIVFYVLSDNKNFVTKLLLFCPMGWR